MRLGFVVKPLIRVSWASRRIWSRSAPSAKIFVEIDSSTSAVLPRDDLHGVPDVAHSVVRRSVPLPTMRGQRILDEDRPTPRAASGLRVDVRVADHPAAGEVEVQLGCGLEQHPGPWLPAVACLRQRRVRRVRVVKAVAIVIDHDSLLGKQSDDALVGLEEVLLRGLSLGRAWLVRDNDRTVVERTDTTDRVR